MKTSGGASRMPPVRQLKRLAILLGVVYILLLMAGTFFINRVLFQPHRSSYDEGPSILKLPVADGVTISATSINPSVTRVQSACFTLPAPSTK